MYKKAMKILFVFMVIWILSLWTIQQEFGTENNVVFFKDDQLYNRALNRLRDKYWNKNKVYTESDFDVWQLFKPVNIILSDEQKLSAIKSSDIPPGINGTPVILEGYSRYSLKAVINKGWRDHAFNQFVSDLIPLNRTLPDPRDKWCTKQKYSKLPKVSIVICFHNEALSTLLRTLHSVINRTPNHLINEIVLFDDFSNMDNLMKPLEDYIGNVSNTILVRSKNRKGLIRSRILAITHTTAPVIVFLDSHCECTKGWIEPLLDRIKQNPTNVVSPVVDQIHDSTFEYIAQDINDLRIGGFNWNLKFSWSVIPREILMKRKELSAPIKTPTISGGLFAINKKYFEKLGYYDEGYDIWGAENLELSFKVWMCGGSLEIVPCSHVGHVFRRRVPYKGEKGSLRRNLVRLAEVWMDDYAKYFYERIGNEKVQYGNVTKRKQIRNKLKCKSFDWYLKNVYPQLQLPDKYVASGQIFNMGHQTMCLDTLSTFPSTKNVKILPCHHRGGNQYWVYTKDGEIRRDEMCLDYIFNLVTLFVCRRRVSSQIWLYEYRFNRIRHMETQRCLQVVRYAERLELILQTCSHLSAQKWTMENYNVERLGPELQIYAKRQM
ncbi:putative polypeptide N-acetylgalactosaminyltransferase 9 [Achroia grisella]|uniref:putative polypeptide N-acetylgalactosaminyltransferase 9 n=1 Tax=Achroia grisella TaxID=688607 RepID=UPI0027D34C96|nr:putative polypeptide N-acetylgalactosaminyltransferase 9 [Achroia grisella]